MCKLVLLFLLSVSTAFADVIFAAGGATVYLSDGPSNTPSEVTLDQWVTTAGSVQSGFLWIHDINGGSTQSNTISSVSIAGIVTGGIFSYAQLVLKAPGEMSYAGGGFIVPFTFGEPFEIKAQIDLTPFGPPSSSDYYAGANLQFSINALTGYLAGYYGNQFNQTGLMAITSSAPSVPEPGTMCLLLGAGAAICGARRYTSGRS